MYKLKLLKKWKIYNVFYMSLLKQNIRKKREIEKITQLKLEDRNSKKYKIKTNYASTVYDNKAEAYLPSFYFLVL